MGNAKLLENYSKMLGSQGKTRSLYLGYARDFLEYSNGNFGRETIERYLEHLKICNYSGGSINFIFRVIRTLASRNKIEWPFARGEAPPANRDKHGGPRRKGIKNKRTRWS